MREKCHKGLARLVGLYGTIQIQRKFLPEVVNASVEPDLENRQKIESNLESSYKIIPTLIKWLYEHTLGAKKLAISNLKNAYFARLKGDQAGISFLGRALHFITDWGTPHHSLFSLADPVIYTTIMGGTGTGIFSLIVNWLNGKDESLKSATKWGLFGAAVSCIFSLIDQYLDHKKFEEQCDEYWDMYENLIIQKFKSKKKKFRPHKSFEEALEIFENKMNDLRNISNNTTPHWILLENGYNFVDYMVQIALVIDFANQIVTDY